MSGLSAEELRRIATRIRLHATRMISIQGFGYLGQALSSAEILAVLFAGVMRHGRDRFVMSAAPNMGHGARMTCGTAGTR